MSRFGEEEQGIDGGGLFKEWLTSLSKEVFDTDRGLWLATEQNELYPNPHAYAKEQSQLEWYTFIGRMLGKALYEGLLMNVSFAGFFLAKWLGRQSYLDDLASLDYDLYKGLIALKNYPGDPEDMSLTFTLDQEEFGQMKSIELKRNGANISVTRANRMECS
jgi:ubiquitin-protein ligase E3 C